MAIGIGAQGDTLLRIVLRNKAASSVLCNYGSDKVSIYVFHTILHKIVMAIFTLLLENFKRKNNTFLLKECINLVNTPLFKAQPQYL